MKRETGAVSRKSSCLERYFRFPEIHDLKVQLEKKGTSTLEELGRKPKRSRTPGWEKATGETAS